MSGYIRGMFTAKGAEVAALHFCTCSFKTSGYMLPLPIIPSAPALLTAEASRQPLVHTIPAWMRGILILKRSVISFWKSKGSLEFMVWSFELNLGRIAD